MPLSVNGEVIDDSAIREEARRLRPRYQEMAGDMDPVAAELQLWEWCRENLIERTLLRQQALQEIEPPPREEVDQALREITSQTGGQAACRTGAGEDGLREEVEIQLRIDRLLQRVTEPLKPPRHKELAEYYRKHREEFRTPEVTAARHIVKNVDEQHSEEAARAAIEEIGARLEAGAPFEKVADEFSDCPGNGGDLGYFRRGEMVAEFDEVVFALEPGQTSGVFRTPFGFHIAHVYARRAEGVAPLAEVQDQIAARLIGEKRQRAVEQYLDRLRARADVRTDAASRAEQGGRP
jgi:peptidyl-prolyl cis-trans isomerase C/foldase protein PrsA